MREHLLTCYNQRISLLGRNTTWIKPTVILIQLRAKLRDWPARPVRACCYSLASSSAYSYTRFPVNIECQRYLSPLSQSLLNALVGTLPITLSNRSHCQGKRERKVARLSGKLSIAGLMCGPVRDGPGGRKKKDCCGGCMGGSFYSDIVEVYRVRQIKGSFRRFQTHLYGFR